MKQEICRVIVKLFLFFNYRYKNNNNKKEKKPEAFRNNRNTIIESTQSNF